MSLGLSLFINVEEHVSARVGALVAGLTGTGRKHLHELIGSKARVLTQDHLREIARTRHDTANRLGAKPTGHWAQGTDKTRVKSDAEGVTVSIFQPGIGRAAHDVDIYPGPGKKFLTIPVRAEAYGQRAYRMPDLFVFKSRTTGDLFLAKRQDDRSKLVLYYLLVPSAHQKQDRTLLPTAKQYTHASLEGVRDYVDLLLRASTATATPIT